MATSDTIRGAGVSPLCSQCPLARNGKPRRPVRGEGPKNPKWIAVGEGPGGVEVVEGRPFVGPSGRMFKRVLEAFELERDDIWIGNATLCQPQGETYAEILEAREACLPRLRDELKQFPGVPVLAMGAVAARTFIGDKFSINELAGSLHDVDIDGTGTRPVIATHHPARILRGGDGDGGGGKAVDLLFWNLIYDAGKVNALAEGDQVRFSDDIQIAAYNKRRAIKLLNGICRDARRLGHCAIDTETTGLNPRKVDLTAIGIATVERAICIAIDVIDVEMMDMIADVCDDPTITKVFHNVPFDEQVLKRYEIYLEDPVEDTLLKHHAAFPGASHKLQDVATQFFAIAPWKAEFRKGRDTLENLLKYCARDALATARLDASLDDAIARTDSRAAYELDRSLIPTAIRMEEAGIPIDLSRNRKLHEGFQKIIKTARAKIEARANDPAIRERFIDEIALIRALKVRKHDPDDFLLRHAKRVQEAKYGIKRKKPGYGQWACHGCGEGSRQDRVGLDLPDTCPDCGGEPYWVTEPKIYLKGKTPIQFTISNADHIAAYLKARGHQLFRLTKGGKPSTKKEILEEMTHIEDVRIILEFREAAKLDSTFVVGLPIEIDHKHSKRVALQTRDSDGNLQTVTYGPWGRLHSSWDIHKITGRWGSSPNCQNWPKDNMRGRPNLRAQVVAPPGRLLVGADYAQLEARVIALLSGDAFLIRIFMENYGKCAAGCLAGQEPVKFCPDHDIHTVFSIEVFPGFLNYDKPARKELRDLTKRGEYGGFYGGAVETLYTSIVKEFPDVSMADVQKIVTTIQDRMPGVAKWHQQLVRDAMQGEIRSAITGRRRAFPLGNAELTIVYNFPVQATAADIVNRGVLALEKRLGETDEIILQGHDAVVVECDEDRAEHVAKIITKSLTQTYTVNGVTMDFPANAAIGRSWDQV